MNAELNQQLMSQEVRLTVWRPKHSATSAEHVKDENPTAVSLVELGKQSFGDAACRHVNSPAANLQLCQCSSHNAWCFGMEDIEHVCTLRQ